MTREEAIKIVNELQDTYIKCRGEEDIIEVSIDSVDIEALDMAIKALEQEPTTKNDFAFLALLEKTYNDFCSCEGGEGWLKIDGKEYATDAGYAIEGVDIFMEVFKRRLAKLPSVTPQEPRIITCKDCKYYRNKGNKRSYCTKRLNVDSVTDRYREPNFYCADAVLREVEE